jgi:hypothetical protein
MDDGGSYLAADRMGLTVRSAPSPEPGTSFVAIQAAVQPPSTTSV